MGLKASATMPDLLVISPHLDDAVLGCGRWLAAHPGATVLTVFAGAPPHADRCRTEWDRRCGFADAAQATALRRAEDTAALDRLRAEPLWLDFLDSQYGDTPGTRALADALLACFRHLSPRQLLLPLGLFHSDHGLCHDAVLQAASLLPTPPDLVAYEDAGYRAMPGLLQRRLCTLHQAGIEATPADDDPCTAGGDCADAKRAAVQAYASQWRALGAGMARDVERPERRWLLCSGQRAVQ
jgi:LmbE family N-acetylglucosaminyl deacetylase